MKKAKTNRGKMSPNIGNMGVGEEETGKEKNKTVIKNKSTED